MTEDASTQSSNAFPANLQSKPPIIGTIHISALMQPKRDQSEANTAKPATSSALGKQEQAAEMQQCLTSTLGCQNLATAPYPSLAISTRRKSKAAALDLKVDAAATCDPSVGNFTARTHTFDAAVAAAQEILVDVFAIDKLTINVAANLDSAVDVAAFVPCSSFYEIKFAAAFLEDKDTATIWMERKEKAAAVHEVVAEIAATPRPIINVATCPGLVDDLLLLLGLKFSILLLLLWGKTRRQQLERRD
ncbi:hypothetical protein ACH5RR_017975 [Cinchona calisaya]|uniref:Uncharacterized protein n=1 Tax=Cinchona calisaya TaxID=153742 RepID=A0ABD2ZK84_9GENT